MTGREEHRALVWISLESFFKALGREALFNGGHGDPNFLNCVW
jgi:hypothetical protein